MQQCQPKSTANFLEPGGDGCELRVTCCGVKNFSIVFFTQFFKVLPRKPATVKHVTRNRFSLFFDGGFRLLSIRNFFTSPLFSPAARGVSKRK
jgi:hypothetical protein